MVQLLLSGCNGRMGHAVEAICAAEPELELTQRGQGGQRKLLPALPHPRPLRR